MMDLIEIKDDSFPNISLDEWVKINRQYTKDCRNELQAKKQIINKEKIGRNDQCFCGSGKKYKKCCLNK